MKHIVVSVTNDLIADNRVHKVCNTLLDMGFRVTLLGRKLPGSPKVSERRYKTKRMHLLFRKGPAFYAEYNLRLFFLLLFSRADVFLANDLDTLLGNVLASRIKRKPVVYDSHEYFTEVPELIHRPRVQNIWKWLEKKLVPQVKAAYTVCHSIAVAYSEKYNIHFDVVRNLPLRVEASEIPEEFKIDDSRPKIIYQGALNANRGLEFAIRAMQFLPEALLVIAGSGDKEQELVKLASEVASGNVLFLGRIPLENIGFYTCQAALGISIEEGVGLNYRFALPNKLFDYIQAEIPVVISDLPEMRKVVDRFNIGLVCPSHNPHSLAKTFTKALFDQQLRKQWLIGLKTAAGQLVWENEKQVVENVFNRFKT